MKTSMKALTVALVAAVALPPGIALAQPTRDGSVTNPPSDAVGRTIDQATGRPTIADGRPGNPPSTALGRTLDRALGHATSPDGSGNNPPGTALDRALERVGEAVTSATGSRPAQQPASARQVPPANRASAIIGANIYNEAGMPIGEVEDLIVQHDGSAPLAVLSVGRYLDTGERLVAVPLTELRFAEDIGRWTLQGATKESLMGRPVVSFAARG